MPPLLRLLGVTKRFGGVVALADVSFELRPGEVHALVGENGAGKSTLVRIMTGAHGPDAGALEVGGRRIERSDPGTLRRLGVAPIYQQPALFPDLTVAENLAFGLEADGLWRRIDWRRRRRVAADLLARVGAQIDVDAPARSLRMAEQQLVEIARALGASAQILLMDEPTSALTGREVDRLFALIRDLRAGGAGIVYISHRLEEIDALADRVTILRDGRHIATRAMGEIDRADVIRLMVGRSVEAVFPKRAVRFGDVVLDVAGLGCRASGLSGIDLRLRAGEIVGLAGLVGAGRTELARTLFGLTPADRGTVRLGGRPVTIDTPSRAVALGLAYVPEDRRRHGVIPEMSIIANTTLAALARVSRAGFLDERRERELAASFAGRFAVRSASLEAPVATLSGGNQQKVVLARWLATTPRVLILDEPTQGVDIGAKAEIHRLIVDLAEEGLAILLISSELTEILGMCDRVAVMCRGAIAGVLDRAEATPERLLALALGHAGSLEPAAVASAPRGPEGRA